MILSRIFSSIANKSSDHSDLVGDQLFKIFFPGALSALGIEIILEVCDAERKLFALLGLHIQEKKLYYYSFFKRFSTLLSARVVYLYQSNKA